MNFKGFTIKNYISDEEFRQIEEWLKNESNKFNGFYYELDYLKKANKIKKLFIIKENSTVVGFLAWNNNEVIVEINIFEIKPKYRRKGIGKYFLDELSKFWKNENFKVMNLFCSPEESEIFWKSIGFIKYPKIKHFNSKIYYFS